MLYIFVLGRDPELSKLEIEAVLENKGIIFEIIDSNKNAVVLESKEKLDPKLIDEFGGIIKIAEVISNSNKIDHIESDLDKIELYDGVSNKIEYYIDEFNTDLISFLEDYLKNYFKSIKVKALYRKSKEPTKLINKEILKRGLNFVIFKSYIGKVVGITNPKQHKFRDNSRPEVDHMKVISIRLAKILVNLAKVKENEVLLDPFCGSGTILQEALLKGIDVVGLDSDEESIKQSNKNLDWLIKSFNLVNKRKITLINGNCEKLTKDIKLNSINGVATEPYMGPFIRKLYSIAEARRLIYELSIMYSNLLSQLKLVLKNHKRVVMIAPKFRTLENKNLPLVLDDIADKNGFTVLHKVEDYGYNKSKILRDVYVLEKN